MPAIVIVTIIPGQTKMFYRSERVAQWDFQLNSQQCHLRTIVGRWEKHAVARTTEMGSSEDHAAGPGREKIGCCIVASCVSEAFFRKALTLTRQDGPFCGDLG